MTLFFETRNTKNRNTVIFLIALVVTMLGLSFASVPLYRLFCQRTGYGGTPKLASGPASLVASRMMIIRFNGDVHRDLPWSFNPLQREMKVRVGETGLAFYQVENLSDQPVIGVATYNVTPDKAAQYFNKVDCFCFEEQKIDGKARVDMPVQFFIDPQLLTDPALEGLDTITLSYTFFHSKNPQILQILGLP